MLASQAGALNVHVHWRHMCLNMVQDGPHEPTRDTQYEPRGYRDKYSYDMNMTTIWYDDDNKPPQKQPTHAIIATICPNLFQLLLQNVPKQAIWFHLVFGLK